MPSAAACRCPCACCRLQALVVGIGGRQLRLVPGVCGGRLQLLNLVLQPLLHRAEVRGGSGSEPAGWGQHCSEQAGPAEQGEAGHGARQPQHASACLQNATEPKERRKSGKTCAPQPPLSSSDSSPLPSFLPLPPSLPLAPPSSAARPARGDEEGSGKAGRQCQWRARLTCAAAPPCSTPGQSTAAQAAEHSQRPLQQQPTGKPAVSPRAMPQSRAGCSPEAARREVRMARRSDVMKTWPAPTLSPT